MMKFPCATVCLTCYNFDKHSSKNNINLEDIVLNYPELTYNVKLVY